MITYRITLEKWAGRLNASGRPARWNTGGHFMIYTAGSRALACLENMVHRRGIGSDDLFRITLIDIPDDLKIKKVSKRKMPANWREYLHYASCQAIGDAWLKDKGSAVLQVPSAIITEEYNYLINPQHTDSYRIKVHAIEKFTFDERLLK